MQSGRVGTEGDELYYEVRGTGQPLLLIPGGGSDGAAYSLIADILCDEFKVIMVLSWICLINGPPRCAMFCIA